MHLASGNILSGGKGRNQGQRSHSFHEDDSPTAPASRGGDAVAHPRDQ